MQCNASLCFVFCCSLCPACCVGMKCVSWVASSGPGNNYVVPPARKSPDEHGDGDAYFTQGHIYVCVWMMVMMMVMMMAYFKHGVKEYLVVD